MQILTELWQMRYIASEACAVVMLFVGFGLSVVAIYVALESKRRVDRKVHKTVKEKGEFFIPRNSIDDV